MIDSRLHFNCGETPLFVTRLNPCRTLTAPHVYGPSLRSRAAAAAGELAFLDAPSFPHNMPQTWHAHWAFAAHELGLAVVVGEWGGSARGADRVWQEAFVQYLLDAKLSSFAWLASHALTPSFPILYSAFACLCVIIVTY